MTRVLIRTFVCWAVAFALNGCVSGFELDEDPLFACLTDGDCLDGYRCLDKGQPYLYGVCRPVVADPCADGWLGEGESDVDCGGTCTACPVNSTCSAGGDCSTGTCEASVCVLRADAAPCEAATQCDSGFCGGPGGGMLCGVPCDAGACSEPNDVCVSGVCVSSALCVDEGAGVFVGPACLCARCSATSTCASAVHRIECVCDPVTATAGDDVYLPGESSVQQHAEPVGVGQLGMWKVLSESPGSAVGTGEFADPSAADTLFTGTPDSAYVLGWEVSNDCDSVTDEVFVSFDPCDGHRTLRDDRDGLTYPVLPLFENCWMTQNLNFGAFVPSDSLAMPGDDGLSQKFCQEDDTANCDAGYGGLYLHDEAMAYGHNGPQGVCPEGWQLGTLDQWRTLLGGGWDMLALGEVPEALDSWGFAAMLGGKLDFGSGFTGFHAYNYNWTSDACSADTCPAHKVYYDNSISSPYNLPFISAATVRCLKTR
ncbi:MAG: hypothetical protein AUK47_18320 [Deltaproteobacteria bacterium CG2_30_63_29]|nr:MAG: hypothetical protein AUK47_18320 [Deltaproteobacteria bacterium CG2_30_63_29]